jgi:hypothetical protein
MMRILLSIFLVFLLAGGVFAGPPEPPGVPDVPEPPDLEELERQIGRIAPSLDTLKIRRMEERLRDYDFQMRDMDKQLAELERLLANLPESILIDNLQIGGDSIIIALNNDSIYSFYNIHKALRADGRGNDDQVSIGSSVVIEEDRYVDGDVVSFFGDVTVNGIVSGGVLTFFGDIYVSSTGYVEESAVAIFGKVKQEPGGQIADLHVALSEARHGPAESPAATTYRVMALVFLIIFFAWLVLSATFYSLLGRNVSRVTEQITLRPWKSFFFGYLAYGLALVLLIALIISLIGIPLAILGVPLLLFAALVMSSTAISCFLGRRVLRTHEKNFRTFLYGNMVLSGIPGALFLLQLITGSLVLMIFSWIVIALFIFIILPLGLGAVLMTRFGTREAKPAPPGPLPQLAPQAQRT